MMKSFARTYGRMGTVQKLTAGVASSQSAAFGTQTRAIRLCSLDNGFYFRIGTGAQVAVTTDNGFPGAWAENIIVHPGEQIAVIRSGLADAAVTVTELDA